jgi:predicted NAD/FAD-binding protein
VSRVAVVGAGVSGLAAAYELRDVAEVAVFEREPRAGGHANTIAVVDPAGGEIGIDTGFIVCNGRTYPQLMAFFEELGVETGALPPLHVVLEALKSAGNSKPSDVADQVRLYYRRPRARAGGVPVAVG